MASIIYNITCEITRLNRKFVFNLYNSVENLKYLATENKTKLTSIIGSCIKVVRTLRELVVCKLQIIILNTCLSNRTKLFDKNMWKKFQ